MTPAPLLLALALSAQSPLGSGALDHATMRPPDGPELRVHHQPGPLVALRLSAPVDPTLAEGAAELLQELARPQAQAIADRFGATLSFRNEGGSAVISVSGPVAAFDALAALLRGAVTELDLSLAAVRGARARAESRVLRRLEQPEPRVERLLWHELFGGSPPRGAAGTALDLEGIRRTRAHLYGPGSLRVTVVGAVPDAVLRSAFSGWATGPLGREEGVALPDSTGEAARPQSHREWVGLGYRVDAEPAVVAVAAALIQERIDRSALRRGTARAWTGPGGPALALVGATEPGDMVVRAAAGIGDLAVEGAGPGEAATGVGRYLRRMIAETAALVGTGGVADARTRLRRELLLEARTVTGRAEVIGRLTDALGPGSASGFLDALESVRLEDVRMLLEAVLGTPAHYVEAR